MPQKAARKKRAQVKQDNTTLLIAGGIIAVVVVGLLLLLNMNLGARPVVQPTASEGKTWGKSTAPVTIDEWSDFQ